MSTWRNMTRAGDVDLGHRLKVIAADSNEARILEPIYLCRNPLEGKMERNLEESSPHFTWSKVMGLKSLFDQIRLDSFRMFQALSA